MLSIVKIKTSSKQKGNLLFVKAHRTDNKAIKGNYFSNILEPFINGNNKVKKVKANPITGRFSATLITLNP